MFGEIDISRYEELSDRLSFSDRKCSDGLCCFITRGDAKLIDVSRNHSMAYYVRRVKDGEIEYEARRFACENLDFDFRNGEIEFSCRRHDSKPEYCVAYPEEGMAKVKTGEIWGDRIILPKVGCTAIELKGWREEGIEVYAFYLFHKRKFPQVNEFAVCSKWKYLLVPVPKIPNPILSRQ